MGSQSINASYRGSVWIEKQSGRVLRLEMQAHDLPEAFPLNRLETDIEFSPIRIADQSTLLPAHVETIGCNRDPQVCSRSVIEFQNYR
jgi:hypothetical protein